MPGKLIVDELQQAANILPSIPPGTVAVGAGAGALAIAGALMVKKPPQIVQRLYYWLEHNRTALTNPKDIEIFQLFHERIVDILETTDSAYPERLSVCLEQFKNQLPKTAVYKFEPIPSFNIQSIFDSFSLGQLKVNGRKIHQDSLTSAVITTVVGLDCMGVAKTLSVPKIIFSFLVSMSLEFASTDNSVEKRDLVNLMLQVALIVKEQRDVRKAFHGYIWEQVTYSSLESLTALYSSYLSNEYHMADAEAVIIAARDFKLYQIDLSKKLFRLLLILTEGSRNSVISMNYEKISKEDLGLGAEAFTGFSPENPFKNFLRSCSALFGPQDESYNLKIDLSTFQLPAKPRIKQFVIANLIKAHSLIERPSILGIFLKKIIEKSNHSFKKVFISLEDNDDIELIVDYLYLHADWLRKFVIMAQIGCTFYCAVQFKGQQWGQGYANFIEKFIKDYESSLLIYSETDHKKLTEYISARTAEIDKKDHNILFLTRSINENVILLQKKGTEPLKQFQQYRLKIAPVFKNIEEKLRSFFSEVVTELKCININVTSVSDGSNVSDVKVVAPSYNPLVTCLTHYANHPERQYKFRLPYLDKGLIMPSDDSRPGEFCYKKTFKDKHPVRAALFYELFKLIPTFARNF